MMKKMNHPPASERTIVIIREGLGQLALHSNEAKIREANVAAMAKAIAESTPVRTTILHVFLNRNPENCKRLAKKYIA
jgi:hypothetical protein